MSSKRLAWLAVAVAVSVIVAYQTVASSSERSAIVAEADMPIVAPGVDVLARVAVVPARIRGYDYRRAAFGEAWTDDNDAPCGHNGCDTRATTFLIGIWSTRRMCPLSGVGTR